MPMTFCNHCPWAKQECVIVDPDISERFVSGTNLLETARRMPIVSTVEDV
jgi:hypothetical protein